MILVVVGYDRVPDRGVRAIESLRVRVKSASGSVVSRHSRRIPTRKDLPLPENWDQCGTGEKMARKYGAVDEVGALVGIVVRQRHDDIRVVEHGLEFFVIFCVAWFVLRVLVI